MTMTGDSQVEDDRLDALIHDLRHCLHVIGMALELLKREHLDAVRFEELCNSIDAEREQAIRLITKLSDQVSQTGK